MANNVFANGREIACKKGSGKSICAFPDVVWTPPDKVPPTPTGVPVPYPNTAMASDTSKGTKKVKVSGKEAMLKNSSNFKKSMGDEAGVAQLKGFLTMKNRGKVYFQMWSMDVKFEGKNVVRHFDIATHNHGSQVGNTPPWPYIDSVAIAQGAEDKCEKEQKREDVACKKLVARNKLKKDGNGPATGAIRKGDTKANICADTDEAKKCREAQKCKLVPQKEGCCPDSGNQAHHVVEAHGFYEAGTRDNLSATALPQFGEYQPGDAPCVCAAGGRAEKEHGAFHALVGKRENAAIRKATREGSDPDFAWSYKDSKQAGVKSFRKIFPKSKCSEACLNAQLDNYHCKPEIGATDQSPVRTTTAALKPWQTQNDKMVLQEMGQQLSSGAGASSL